MWVYCTGWSISPRTLDAGGGKTDDRINVKVYVNVSVMVNNITELTQELSFSCHQLNSKKYYGTDTVQLSFTCA
jgi:hypothetical protein